MPAAHIEFLVEEPSMEAALGPMVPKIIGLTSFQIYPHGGKSALLSRLQDRLNGYRSWLREDCRIVVLIDRDEENCIALKRRIVEMVRNAGLLPRGGGSASPFNVLTRIVVEELETWYFGDWAAMRSAYPRLPATLPQKPRYRDPDAITNAWETLERVMRGAGYFTGGLRKLELAASVGPHMDPARNTSRSFQVFRDGLAALCAA
jgi:hypothetical protein